MHETTKTRRLWGPLERAALEGEGIDIGCGPDPVFPDAMRFDVEQGDAGRITEYVHRQFDYVYSSHCLEHMHDPASALLEWWKLVKPGGHLMFIVPDEDLYEQGVFPSRFNADHKATFTISKLRSWSPVSYNVLDLARSLPDAELVSLALQDNAYDRGLQRWGPEPKHTLRDAVLRRYRRWKRKGRVRRIEFLERIQAAASPLDQTMAPDVVAQIQCILRKKS
jgi:SAM-dependent methyltransferase